MKTQNRKQKRLRRHQRIRAKVSGTAEIPRLSVFFSNRHLLVQLVDDIKNKTILSASDREIKKGLRPVEKAREAGRALAVKAIEKKIEKVVFDRGGYQYHGKVKALAEGAREGGLKF